MMRLVNVNGPPPEPTPDPAEQRLKGIKHGVRVKFGDGEWRHYPRATEYAIVGALLVIDTDTDTLAVLEWGDVKAVEAGGATSGVVKAETAEPTRRAKRGAA